MKNSNVPFRPHKVAMIIILSSIWSCSQVEFAPIDLDEAPQIIDLSQPDTNPIASEAFKISESQISHDQELTSDNSIQIMFQAKNILDDSYLNDLTADQISLMEDKTTISKFEVVSNAENYKNSVDIIFGVDVTGSMTPSIEAAKVRLLNFIDSSRSKGYHTRMCLITFGDYTVQNCDRFYDNNPQDPSTLKEVEELKSEITKLKALKGTQDPGGYDLAENPMQALIDASNAPWGNKSQKFLILMTDADFLYSPSKQGTIGSNAPTFEKVIKSINQSQMKVFAVTPDLNGYSKNFNVYINGKLKTYPSIVEESAGEHFLFNDLISGVITLDTVLDKILTQVKTSYQLSYVIDEYSDLDPTLPLNKRDIKLAPSSLLPNSDQISFTVSQTTSTHPDGIAKLKKSFKLTGKEIKTESIKVRINGVNVTTGWEVSDGYLVFKKAPKSGSKIQVTYVYKNIADALLFKPIYLEANTNLNQIAIYINGIKAKSGDIVFKLSEDGRWIIDISPDSLNDKKFKIEEQGQALVTIYKVKTI